MGLVPAEWHRKNPFAEIGSTSVMLHSVIVGVDTYKDPDIPRLRCARNDAESFAALLTRRVRDDECRVTLLVDEQATRQNVVRAIGEALPREAQADDVVLLYFACHGSPEMNLPTDDPSPYLILHDTDYNAIFSTGVDMAQDVVRWFERIRHPRLVVLFIDACFSGRAGGRTFEGPVFAKNRATPEYRSGDGNKLSIKDLRLGKGRVIITSADEHQVAKEDAALGHGIFTYHLLDILARPVEEGATIQLTRLYEDVAQSVQRATGDQQHPVFHGRAVHGALPRLG